MTVRLLLAVVVALGLSAASAPQPRDLLAPGPSAALVDDAGDDADLALAASGPVLAERSVTVEPLLATPPPVLYHHPLFVFRPPRGAAFN